MRTRVQQRVLYSESAQVKLGGGRGRFDDKKIRVGPAYQAVIPVLGSWSNADETARAGYVQAQEECQHGPVMARTKRRTPASYYKAKHATKEAGATPAAEVMVDIDGGDILHQTVECPDIRNKVLGGLVRPGQCGATLGGAVHAGDLTPEDIHLGGGKLQPVLAARIPLVAYPAQVAEGRFQIALVHQRHHRAQHVHRHHGSCHRCTGGDCVSYPVTF